MMSSMSMVAPLLENSSSVTPPPLAVSLATQTRRRKGFAVETLGHDAPAPANASPCFHQKHAAEQIRLDVEPVEAPHIARRVCALKMHGAHASSLEILLYETLNIRAISRVGSPASRRLIASFFWCGVSFGGRPM
jgi:hypothetical protein